MTKSRELAREIALVFGYDLDKIEFMQGERRERLESLLDEALREAENSGFHKAWNAAEVGEQLRIARLSQIQKDAEIAEKWHPQCPEGEWTIARNEIAKAIRTQNGGDTHGS